MQHAMSDQDRERPASRPPLVYRAARMLSRLVGEPDYRHVIRMLRWRAKGAFQPLNDTREDRYPRIFDFVQSLIGATNPVRILSFGCSTGEEVFTLRRRFPAATIRGLDINPGNIAICRRRLKQRPDTKLDFTIANSTDNEPSASYDVIFCMAVLQDGRLRTLDLDEYSPLISFADFARVIEDFHRCLKPGGILVIHHSNFRLYDAPIGKAFEVLLRLPVRVGFPPIYGPDNRLMSGVTCPDTVFRKQPA